MKLPVAFAPYLRREIASPIQEEIRIDINENKVDNIEELVREIYFRNKLQPEEFSIVTIQCIVSYYKSKKKKIIPRETISREDNNLFNDSTLIDRFIDSEKVYDIPDPASEFAEKHEYALKSMLTSEISESGVVNLSEEYFGKMIDEDHRLALNLVNKIFMDCISTNNREYNLLVNVLHLLSHFDYQKVYPWAQTMAIAALGHKNAEVRDYAIKCYENWKNPDGIKNLKAVKFNEEWLQEYANAVIKELENLKELHKNGVVS